MKIELQAGKDSWLRQIEIRDTQRSHKLAYYQNCLTHCCGLSGLAQLFEYNSDLTKKDIGAFVKQFQEALDNGKAFGYGVGEGPLFQSPCIMFTTSEENDGNNSVQLLKQHPQVSKKFDFRNKNGNIVEVWAIELTFDLEEDY